MRIFFVLAVWFLALPSPVIAAEVERFNVPIGISPQLGPQEAPVTVIEFLDFQ